MVKRIGLHPVLAQHIDSEAQLATQRACDGLACQFGVSNWFVGMVDAALGVVRIIGEGLVRRNILSPLRPHPE